MAESLHLVKHRSKTKRNALKTFGTVTLLDNVSLAILHRICSFWAWVMKDGYDQCTSHVYMKIA
jgi:hypothetical protein